MNKCEWFRDCKREATDTEPHPILKSVPICSPCKQRLKEMDEKWGNR